MKFIKFNNSIVSADQVVMITVDKASDGLESIVIHLKVGLKLVQTTDQADQFLDDIWRDLLAIQNS